MDASAFIERDAWEKILAKLGLEDIEISDNRYNHVVHMQVKTSLSLPVPSYKVTGKVPFDFNQ
jgi:hypothetical protein